VVDDGAARGAGQTREAGDGVGGGGASRHSGVGTCVHRDDERLDERLCREGYFRTRECTCSHAQTSASHTITITVTVAVTITMTITITITHTRRTAHLHAHPYAHARTHRRRRQRYTPTRSTAHCPTRRGAGIEHDSVDEQTRRCAERETSRWDDDHTP
jgi:hypothetical protein